MQIHIHIERPWLSACVIVAVMLWIGASALPQSGAMETGGAHDALLITQAERDIGRERLRQAVLDRREEILRFQVEIMEQETRSSHTSEAEKELADHRAVLIGILRERTASERLLKASLEQLWEAQGTDFTANAPASTLRLSWPVRPSLGISAHFEDDAYEKRFGIPHHAIDIPTEQGTIIRAPADGTVENVALNGLGYSYVILKHRDNIETVYGHIGSSLVQAGDSVHAGDAIARSGGQPGSIGAGLLTTGPHLHFAVKNNGKLVDPMRYLKKESQD